MWSGWDLLNSSARPKASTSTPMKTIPLRMIRTRTPRPVGPGGLRHRAFGAGNVSRDRTYSASRVRGVRRRRFFPTRTVRRHVPAPHRTSDAYETRIAPELSLYGTEATTRTGALTVSWTAPSCLTLWAQGKLARLSPTTSLGQLQFAPQGTRTRSRIEVGVTMRGGGERQ